MSLVIDADTLQIIITRGDDQEIRFTVTDENDVVVDVSGATVAKFTVKRDPESAEEFQKTIGSGIDMTSAGSGLIDVTIDAADTASLAGRYEYDLEILTAASKINTLTQGIFFVKRDIT